MPPGWTLAASAGTACMGACATSIRRRDKEGWRYRLTTRTPGRTGTRSSAFTRSPNWSPESGKRPDVLDFRIRDRALARRQYGLHVRGSSRARAWRVHAHRQSVGPSFWSRAATKKSQMTSVPARGSACEGRPGAQSCNRALGGHAYGYRAIAEWREALNAYGRMHMRHVSALFIRLRWYTLRPDVYARGKNSVGDPDWAGVADVKQGLATYCALVLSWERFRTALQHGYWRSILRVGKPRVAARGPQSFG